METSGVVTIGLDKVLDQEERGQRQRLSMYSRLSSKILFLPY